VLKLASTLVLAAVILGSGVPRARAADYIPDAHYAVHQLEAAFFAGDAAEARYALRRLIVACESQEIATPPLHELVDPCDLAQRVLESGCGSGSYDPGDFRCAGAIVALAIAREHGLPADAGDQMRDILNAIHSIQGGELGAYRP